jgi:hypothetical protein
LNRQGAKSVKEERDQEERRQGKRQHITLASLFSFSSRVFLSASLGALGVLAVQ